MKTSLQRLATALLILNLPLAHAGEPQKDQVLGAEVARAAAWGSSKMTLVVKGQKKDRGYALFTTDENSPGIAFRCDRKKIYAFVSVKPMSFRKLLGQWFRNPAEWQVEYRVDDDALRDETWIWLLRGKVFMSQPDGSANDLFRAAKRGSTVWFQRKHGDPVTIEIPAGDPARFDGFVEKCGLKLMDLGSTEA